jgi:homoprotocatechuate degradation regulator HpaR
MALHQRPSSPAVAPAPFKHRNLPQLLLLAREAVLSSFRPLLNQHGLTEQQWRILRVLVESGPMEPRQIGAQCGVSSASLAGILARMEQTGLVERVRFARDQRRVLVSTTRASRQLAAKLAPSINAIYDDLATRLGGTQLRALQANLDQTIERLRS